MYEISHSRYYLLIVRRIVVPLLQSADIFVNIRFFRSKASSVQASYDADALDQLAVAVETKRFFNIRICAIGKTVLYSPL